MTSFRTMNDALLLVTLARLVTKDRATTAQIIACLLEVDRRAIWATDGYPSLFEWCMARFHMSESMTYKRLAAVGVAKRYPIVLGMLERGELHLSAVAALSKHLTDANHVDVLERARHKTTREVEKLVAELAPKPDVKTKITPVREPRAVAASGVVPLRLVESPGAKAVGPQPDAPQPQAAPPKPAPPSKVAATSPGRFTLTTTISSEAHEKLRKLQGLLSHALPSGDAGAILERALDALLEKTLRDRAGKTTKPRSTDRSPRERETRYVPRPVRDAVWQRDEHRCAFVGTDGHRCGSTWLVEMHHIEPFARGGAATVDNLSLRCAVHNRLEANRDFGELFMASKARSARTTSATWQQAPPARD